MEGATKIPSTDFKETSDTFQEWNCTQSLKTFSFCIISALLLYPALFVLLVPILIYRQVIQLLVLNTDPKCKKMLTGWDAILAAQDPYVKPLTGLCPYFVFSEKCDINHIKNMFNEKVLKPNKYPNLRQRIIRKCGYYFWYDVENFDLNNHIRHLHPDSPDTPVKITEIRHLCVKFAGDNYDPNISPWEIIVVPNLYDDANPSVKSCVLVRTQHCLMDGFGVAKLVRTLSAGTWEFSGSRPRNSPHKIGLLEKNLKLTYQILLLLFTGPYRAVKMMLYTDDKSQMLEDALDMKPDHFLGILERDAPRSDGAKLKQIRDSHKVGMSSLLIALAVESIKRAIKKRHQNRLNELPKQVMVHMSFPLPNHPDELTNHWTFVRFPVQLRQQKTSLETLKEIHNTYEQIRTSVIPLVTHTYSKILGSLPIILRPKLDGMMTQTIILINFPGPNKKTDLFGYPWEYCAVLSNPIKGAAYFAACQNYAGTFWIDLGGMNNLILGQHDLDELQENVRVAINELENAAGNNIKEQVT